MDILTNKQYKDYNSVSRYSAFPIYYNTRDNKWVMGSTNALSQDCQYSVHKVLKFEDYDTIALLHYGNPTLYWVICDFNNIVDPFVPPAPGSTLKIPVLSHISFDK